MNVEEKNKSRLRLVIKQLEEQHEETSSEAKRVAFEARLYLHQGMEERCDECFTRFSEIYELSQGSKLAVEILKKYLEEDGNE